MGNYVEKHPGSTPQMQV